MDQELLVERIDDGHKLIIELLRDGFDVTAAFWVRTSEDGTWLLYINSETVDVKKVSEAYRRVYACLNRLGPSSVAPSEVKLINPSNPISVAAVLVRDRYPGRMPTRFQGKRLGPMAVDEVYIYPRERWFKGFEDTKKHFPSAEILTLPILSKDVFTEAARRLIGHINASTFEGRVPGTVYFLGPQGSSGKALGELLFIYRPEGWNTLFRADTNSWQEVVHVQTGEKLYQTADFGPLQAMKSEQQPAARVLDIIKKLMEEGGHYLKIPPDPTPIYSIPYTPAPSAEEEAPTTIDWETIRRIMEAGGTIEVKRAAAKANE